MNRAAGLMIVLALGALAGCADRDVADPRPAPAATGTITPAPTADDAYATGLDIQYLDDDGELKTLEVEDFPR